MKRTKTSFAGYDCIKLANSDLALWVTISAGPRILGLSVGGSDNLLAVVPEATSTTPSGLTYTFRGGHRLWHAPEDPERTYVPDDGPVLVEEIEGGLRLTQAVEKLTGIEKSMSIVLVEGQNRAVINHTLTNLGRSPVELAPWAITQLRAGGFGILPQPVTDTGLLPNRRLSLWPYTNVNSRHIQWGNRFIFVQANMKQDKIKLGWPNPAGWLGYWLAGTLFVKKATFSADGDYYDFGSSSECYCDPRFLELETLGPRVSLEPAEKVDHKETWTLYTDVTLSAEEDGVAMWVDRLGIGY